MNTQKHSIETPVTTKSARTPADRKRKTTDKMEAANPATQAGKDEIPALTQTALAPAPAFVALAPSFIALANQFGMVPERLAERVIAAFAATRPSRIVVKARASSGQGVR